MAGIFDDLAALLLFQTMSHTPCCTLPQVTLTFVVYDWDGPLIGDDLLGVAKLALSEVIDKSCNY